MDQITLKLKRAALDCGMGVVANLPVGLEFERDGYPATEAEALENGFTVEPKDAEQVLTLVKGFAMNATVFMGGHKPEPQPLRKARHD